MMAAERGGGEDEDMRAVVAEVAAEVHRAGWVSLERVRRGGVRGKVRVCEQVARVDDAERMRHRRREEGGVRHRSVVHTLDPPWRFLG